MDASNSKLCYLFNDMSDFTCSSNIGQVIDPTDTLIFRTLEGINARVRRIMIFDSAIMAGEVLRTESADCTNNLGTGEGCAWCDPANSNICYPRCGWNRFGASCDLCDLSCKGCNGNTPSNCRACNDNF